MSRSTQPALLVRFEKAQSTKHHQQMYQLPLVDEGDGKRNNGRIAHQTQGKRPSEIHAETENYKGTTAQ